MALQLWKRHTKSCREKTVSLNMISPKAVQVPDSRVGDPAD